MAPDARKPGTGINIFIDDDPPITGARIKVIGIGGGGGNAVNRMIEAGIEGIEFLVANTDLQALKRSRAPIKIQLGSRLTKGLGAGADPGVGREAALEDTDKIIEVRRRGYGLCDHWYGWRHGHGRRSDHCLAGYGVELSHSGRGNKAVPVRRSTTHAAGGSWSAGAARMCRHGDQRFRTSGCCTPWKRLLRCLTRFGLPMMCCGRRCRALAI